MPQGQKNPKTEEEEEDGQQPTQENGGSSKRKAGAQPKRRCVSSACIACRKRKSKCDGNTPSCAACSSVYFSECIYDPSSDHRRKTSTKKDTDSLKTRNSTLQVLMQAILTYPEDEVYQLVDDIRGAENLDELANEIAAQERSAVKAEKNIISEEGDNDLEDSGIDSPNLEADMSVKMGSLRLDSDGQIKSYGGTSLLSLLSYQQDREANDHSPAGFQEGYFQPEDPITSWTTVTKDKELIVHLINMYFTWHYTYFTTLSKSLFFRDFLKGKPTSKSALANSYCTPLLVQAMLALGCHFTSRPGARSDPNDPATAGNHFFQEAKRLILENDEHEVPRLTTVQALGLMSVREAGCGREARGWVYSGMSFRMACDLGLHLNPDSMAGRGGMSDEEIDARKITLWGGSYLFDKCWSNYVGRMPQLPSSIITCPKFDVFPEEDSQPWSPYTDNGLTTELSQPSRTRAVSLQLSALCEISNDILIGFYVPTHGGTTNEARFKKGERDNEMKRLVGLHARLEEWGRKLPAELEAKEGALPNALVMHMFCQLLYLLLFRPFLKLGPGGATFPAHIQPRKICTNAATTISKYLRLYKRTYGLKQICNVVVYICLSAVTIHLINLPTKAAKRDIVQGVKSLEEIADYWLCAKRALIIVKVLANRYGLELPEEAEEVLARMNSKGEMFGFKSQELQSPPKSRSGSASAAASPSPKVQHVPATPNTQLTDDILRQFESQSPGFLMPTGTHPGAGPSLNSVSNFFTPYFDPGSSPSGASASSQQASMIPSPNIQMPTYVPTTSGTPNAPPLFAGFDSLVDQSQQWWLKDQAQLAMDYGQDWPGGGYSPPVSMGGSEHSGDGFMNFNATMDTTSSGNRDSNNGSPWA